MSTPITSPLDEGARSITGRLLQETVADLVDLSLVGKQAHWNLVGRHFRDVHLHLDELVAIARTHTDSAAERAAAIGVSPDGRAATVAESSGLPDFPAGWAADRDVVLWVAHAVDVTVRRIRVRIDEAEKPDQITHDLLIEIGRALEQARWMWQAEAVGFSDH